MIKIEVNNERVLQISQKEDGAVLVETGANNSVDRRFIIEEGDMVMLVNYFRYIKENDIQCDFINPQGKEAAR
mgnify:CR=1 FL=1